MVSARGALQPVVIVRGTLQHVVIARGTLQPVVIAWTPVVDWVNASFFSFSFFIYLRGSFQLTFLNV